MAVTKGLILAKETEPDSGMNAEYWKITLIVVQFSWYQGTSSSSVVCTLNGWLNKNKYNNGKKSIATLSYNFSNEQYRINNANPDQQIYDLLVVLPEWSGAVIDT